MKICFEFGALGILLYSSLRNLTFFDLEKKMLESATARATSLSTDLQPEPLDFIRPVILYFLNTIMEYCVDEDPEMVLSDTFEEVFEGIEEAYYNPNTSTNITKTPDKSKPVDEVLLTKTEMVLSGPASQIFAGTASTAASDSMCAPFLENSDSKDESPSELLKNE